MHGDFDRVSSAGIRASGTRRVVVETWGAVAAWFALVQGVITRRAQERTRSVYDYHRVMLETDQGTLRISCR